MNFLSPVQEKFSNYGQLLQSGIYLFERMLGDAHWRQKIAVIIIVQLQFLPDLFVIRIMKYLRTTNEPKILLTYSIEIRFSIFKMQVGEISFMLSLQWVVQLFLKSKDDKYNLSHIMNPQTSN